MNKKLSLSKEDMKIFGVCSGIAKYFNLDISLVRIATVVLALFFPSVIFIYLVIWFILPDNNIKKSL
jgi:phage shock protein PspC (stress-responsive transcriptional regulator)